MTLGDRKETDCPLYHMNTTRLNLYLDLLQYANIKGIKPNKYCNLCRTETRREGSSGGGGGGQK